jgi:hypothetical protein
MTPIPQFRTSARELSPADVTLITAYMSRWFGVHEVEEGQEPGNGIQMYIRYVAAAAI